MRTALMAVLAVAAALGGARIAHALATPGPFRWMPRSTPGRPRRVVARWPAIRAARLACGTRRRPVASEVAGLARRSGQVARDRRGDRSAGAWGIVAALRAWPDGWWVAVTLGSIAVELVFTVVAPVLIVPLFLRSHPLPPGPLADDPRPSRSAPACASGRCGCSRRARRCRPPTPSSPASGPTSPHRALRQPARRRPRYRQADRAETRSVLAHEFGHHASRRSLAPERRLGCHDRALAGRGGRGASAVAGGACASQCGSVSRCCRRCSRVSRCTQVVTGIALGAYSRRRERAADRYGVDLIGDGEPFARALEHLSPRPIWRNFAHRAASNGSVPAVCPPPSDRIARARSQGKENPTSGANGGL